MAIIKSVVQHLLRNRVMLILAFCLSIRSPYSVSQTTPLKQPTQTTEVSFEEPRFAVASIKPGTDDGHFSFQITPDGMSIVGLPMRVILREAFVTQDDRIVGAPGWVNTKKFDIQARVDSVDVPKLEHLTGEQRRSMLIPLLVERFNLKYHHEMRDLQTYSLVVAKSGIKMKTSQTNDGQHFLRRMGIGHLEAKGTDLHLLAGALSQVLGQSVVDKTGLAGSFDYTLEWTPDDAPLTNSSDPVGPSIFTALQEQLGLKLESSKSQGDVIVIDHLDLPSDN